MRHVRLLPLIAMLAFAFAALFPLLMRLDAGAPATPGPGSYEELREAELLIAGDLGLDPITQRRFAPSPYTALLAGMVFLGVPWLLPILLTLALFGMLHLQLPVYMRDREARSIALLVLAVSPVTSVFATHHVPALLALCLLLIGLRARFSWPWYTLAILTAPIMTGVLLLALLVRTGMRRDARASLGIATVLAIGAWWMTFWKGIPTTIIEPTPLFFEFGAKQGISIFILILAVYGLIVGKFSAMRISSVLGIVAATLLFPSILPAAAVVLAAFAGHGVANLLRHKWELDLLRQSLLILVCCLGIFLLVVAARERVSEQPTAELTRTMIYLSQQHRAGNVLAAPDLGSVIIMLSNREPVPAAKELFLSRDADRLYDFLEATDANFILITQGMREELFSRSDEGILFLLPNTERFVLMNVNEENQLWYYIRR